MPNFSGSEQMPAQPGKIWYCKIGEATPTEDGADLPMREAVKKIFTLVTGEEPEYVFSGWDGKLTDEEQIAVNTQRFNTQQEENVLDRVEIYLDKGGEWRWRAVARNEKIVADSSEGYKNFVDAKGMAMRLFPSTRIVEFDK